MATYIAMHGRVEAGAAASVQSDSTLLQRFLVAEGQRDNTSPCCNGSHCAATPFLQAAWEVLRDERLRRDYDARLAVRRQLHSGPSCVPIFAAP
eukprot:6187751-Pleurochrysis_carterae.AAC.3